MNCPSCDKPFYGKTDGNGFWAWCPWGHCKSRVSNDGAFSEVSIEHAENVLANRIEAEMEQQETDY